MTQEILKQWVKGAAGWLRVGFDGLGLTMSPLRISKRTDCW